MRLGNHGVLFWTTLLKFCELWVLYKLVVFEFILLFISYKFWAWDILGNKCEVLGNNATGQPWRFILDYTVKTLWIVGLI